MGEERRKQDLENSQLKLMLPTMQLHSPESCLQGYTVPVVEKSCLLAFLLQQLFFSADAMQATQGFG